MSTNARCKPMTVPSTQQPDSIQANPVKSICPENLSVCGRRVRQDPEMITNMGAVSLDAAPFATTLNAQLFHAHSNDPHNADIVVVKRTRLATVDDAGSATFSYSDDPIREIHVAAHVANRGGHPHVVRCRGAFLDHEMTHVVMENCPGGDLFTHLKQNSNSRLPQKEALDIFLQIARGVQFLHLCNVAHRDLSVENVLLGSDGRWKLCDFGLSVEADMTSTATVGKAHYMAPEVVARRPYDPIQADIWSLGITLFILLTGSPLVKIASANADDFRGFQEIGCHGVIKLWKLDDSLSFPTMDLLDGMLQVDPRDRYKNVAEILDHPALLAAAAKRVAAQEGQ